jgi:uncharacterized protein YhjY with autotransporter beta-barrel domain
MTRDRLGGGAPMTETENKRAEGMPSTKQRCPLRASTVVVCLLALLLGARSGLAASTGTASVTSVTFSPATIAKGGTSALTVTLSASATATSAQLIDTLPIGLSATSTSTNSCGGSVSLGSGGAEVTLSGGTITVPDGALSGSCNYTVMVKASASSSATSFTNTIPASALSTIFGPGVGSGASGTLTVQSATVVVPSVAGQSQAAATSRLASVGLGVTVALQYSSTVAAGVVIGTQPSAGASAAPGTTVQLLVSRGPGTQSAQSQTPPPGLTTEEQSVWRGLTQTCAALAGSAASLNPKQLDLLNKCTALIDQYGNGTNAPALAQALDSISGRQATASARIPMQFAAGQLTNLSDRLNAVREGSAGIDIGGLDPGIQGSPNVAISPVLTAAQRWLNQSLLGGGAGDAAGGVSNRLGIFVTGTLRRGTETTTDAEQGFDFRNNGLTAGVDYRFGESYVLGLAGGYGSSTTTFDDAGGRLDAKHYSGSLYQTYYTGPFHVDLLLGMGHNSYGLVRDINYNSSSVSVGCNGVTCTANTLGSTGARDYDSSLAFGGDFHIGALEFGPILEGEYKQVGVNGFSESSSSGLNLNLGAITSTSLLSKLGGYANWAIKSQWAVIVPQVQVRYLHEFMNDARTQSAQFAEDTLPGAASRGFVIYTDQPDRNYMDYKASILFQFAHGIAGFVDYGGIAGLQDIRMHEFNVGFRIEPGLL